MKFNLKKMVTLVAALLLLGAAAVTFGPMSAAAAESSFKFSKAFTGIQAQILAKVFNTSTGHSHDGSDSKQLAASALASGIVDSRKLATVFFDIKTKAQMSAATPSVGQAALCSNCTAPYSLCIGTAAVLSGWARVQTGTVDTTKIGCGTNE